jgi:hypothetical protein
LWTPKVGRVCSLNPTGFPSRPVSLFLKKTLKTSSHPDHCYHSNSPPPVPPSKVWFCLSSDHKLPLNICAGFLFNASFLDICHCSCYLYHVYILITSPFSVPFSSQDSLHRYGRLEYRGWMTPVTEKWDPAPRMLQQREGGVPCWLLRFTFSPVLWCRVAIICSRLEIPICFSICILKILFLGKISYIYLLPFSNEQKYNYRYVFSCVFITANVYQTTRGQSLFYVFCMYICPLT